MSYFRMRVILVLACVVAVVVAQRGPPPPGGRGPPPGGRPPPPGTLHRDPPFHHSFTNCFVFRLFFAKGTIGHLFI